MTGSLHPDSAAAAAPDGDGTGPQIEATQRARWATRRMTIRSGNSKKKGIRNRQRQRGNGEGEKSNGENRDHNDPKTDDTAASDLGHESAKLARTLYFNQPLPPEYVDEENNPILTFPRNKIRTAKYTPLSFVPKNLWIQFHNVANIYFLFLVILVVSYH